MVQHHHRLGPCLPVLRATTGTGWRCCAFLDISLALSPEVSTVGETKKG